MDDKLTPDFCVGIEARILDSWFPFWYKQVNITLLDMSTTNRCVAGQLKWPDTINKSSRSTTNLAYGIGKWSPNSGRYMIPDADTINEVALEWQRQIRLRYRWEKGNDEDGLVPEVV